MSDQVREVAASNRQKKWIAGLSIALTLVVGILIGTLISGKTSAMKNFSFAGKGTPLVVPDSIPSSNSFAGIVNRVVASTPGAPGPGGDADTTVVAPQRSLALDKAASRTAVEIADVVDYTLHVHGPDEGPVANVVVEDCFPAGFAYVPGSARVDGVSIPDPALSRGARQKFKCS